MDGQRSIAVVGAGIAGLSCAYELHRAGLHAVVYEKEESVGGRMRTRTKDALSFDLGANFLVAAYTNLLALAEELGVKVECISPVDHVFLREGSWHSMNISSARDVLKMETIKVWKRLKLLEFLLRIHRTYPRMDFFDLSTIADTFHQTNAYDCAREAVGTVFADYIVDAFHSCMMFYRARETSAAAFLALFQMRTDRNFDFSILHTRNEMQEIPNALAGRLDVRKGQAVTTLRKVGTGWEVRTPADCRVYQDVVLATTGGAGRTLLAETPCPHLELLSATRYASTVNLSFRMDRGALGHDHCFYIPYVENPLIAEFTNEALKGENAIQSGQSLVNVGLHEEAAVQLAELPDQGLFQRVASELVKLRPDIGKLTPHDLQRWPEAIPKYDVGHVARVKKFLAEDQGSDGLYLCGDYMNAPWLEGASRSGKRVAEAILAASITPHLR